MTPKEKTGLIIAVVIAVLAVGVYLISRGGGASPPPPASKCTTGGYPCSTTADCQKRSLTSYCLDTNCCYGLNSDGSIDTNVSMTCP